MKKSYIVDSTCKDMRLDRWLKINIGKIPQSLIEKYLRNGKIKLNKKKVKSSYKLRIQDEINTFNIEFKEVIQQKKNKFSPSKEIIKSNEDQIIDNNDNFIVLNKPSGISVQGGTKSKKNLVDIFSKSKIFSISVSLISSNETNKLYDDKYFQINLSVFSLGSKINEGLTMCAR